MNNLILLKRLLNSISDKELQDMELWIDNSYTTQLIAVDDNAVTIVSEGAKVKINDMEW